MDCYISRMLQGWHFGIVGRHEHRLNGITENMVIKDETNKTIKNINQKATKKARSDLQLKHNSESLANLTQTEKSLKIGFACLFLKYFTTLNALQQETERIPNDDRSSFVGKKRDGRNLTNERLRMIEREKNILHRKRLNEEAYEKAKRGEERRQLREQSKAIQTVSFNTVILLVRTCQTKKYLDFIFHVERPVNTMLRKRD